MSEETIPQMREALDAKDKTIQGQTDQIEKLNQQVRASESREAFRDAGYNPKHGDLFAQQNPEGDITPELVASFAGEWDLSPAAEGTSDGGDGTDSDDDGTDALDSMDRSGSRAGEGGSGSSDQQTYTRQEFLEMQMSDPVKAATALNQGRVLISTSGNLRSGQDAAPGRNPYEPVISDS